MFRTNVRHRVLFTIDCRESLVARSCRENFYRVVILVILYCRYTVYIKITRPFPVVTTSNSIVGYTTIIRTSDTMDFVIDKTSLIVYSKILI